MTELNLPEYDFRIRTADGRQQIFDEVRKSWVALTPEERVRQHLIKYLQDVKEYPQSLIAVEKSLQVYSLKKRTDIVVYNKKGSPVLIVECKAPYVKISQDAFDQAARYNIKLRVNYLLLSNGIDHYCCSINLQEGSYSFLRDIPAYDDLTSDSGFF